MTNSEVVKMLQDLEGNIRDVNSRADALLANKVKVKLSVEMQGNAFDGEQPILNSNTKKLLEEYTDPELNIDHNEGGVGY